MTLAAEQHAFLRLTTNAREQDQFFENPEHVGASWGLTRETIAQLILRGTEIRRFSRSLHNKRRHELAHLLPHSQRALRPAFAEWFQRYCRECPGAGQQARDQEARCFAEYLAKQTQLPAARFEAAAWRARTTNRRLTLAWLGGWRCVVWWRARGSLHQWPGRITLSNKLL